VGVHFNVKNRNSDIRKMYNSLIKDAQEIESLLICEGQYRRSKNIDLGSAAEWF
jgi:hypothetical protein